MQLLGISRQEFWRWRKQGKVPPGVRHRDGRLLFSAEDVAIIRVFQNEVVHFGGESRVPAVHRTIIQSPDKIPFWRELKIFARPRLVRPPGAKLLQLAEFLYSRKTFKDVLEPTILDLQDEHAEALSQGRQWKASWVRVRGTWSFFNAAGLFAVVSVGKRLVAMWKIGG
jgi:hypothetical protein